MTFTIRRIKAIEGRHGFAHKALVPRNRGRGGGALLNSLGTVQLNS